MFEGLERLTGDFVSKPMPGTNVLPLGFPNVDKSSYFFICGAQRSERRRVFFAVAGRASFSFVG
jgi:hypothetical protein